MSKTTTTVSAKMQVTIPKEIRRAYGMVQGTRLAWGVEDGHLVARRVRTIEELAGCLGSGKPFKGVRAEKRAVDLLRAKLYSRKYRA